MYSLLDIYVLYTYPAFRGASQERSCDFIAVVREDWYLRSDPLHVVLQSKLVLALSDSDSSVKELHDKFSARLNITSIVLTDLFLFYYSVYE